jgi:hypothetical protein
MTDYYPLIARAVTALDKNTGEARRGLYERARGALVAQLRGLDPPLTESEITRERLALEEAIRRVEAESARRPRAEPQRPEPVAALKANEIAAAPEPVPAAASGPLAAAHMASGAAPGIADRDPPRGDPRMNGAGPNAGDVGPFAPRPRPRSDRVEADDSGLRGFRDVVAEAETLGEATAQAAKSAREAYAAVPTNTTELDHDEVRGPRLSGRESVGRSGKDIAPGLDLDGDEPFPRIVDSRTAPRPIPGHLEAFDQDTEGSEARASRGPLWAGVGISAFLAVVAAFYMERDRLTGWLATSPAGPQSQQDTALSQTKITDRVSQNGSPAPGQTNSTGGDIAAVAQRAVLYEEEPPPDTQGKQYIGSVVWKTETVSPGPGQPPELAIRADLEIADRRMTMTMSVRRNTDKALPASHTIEIMFNLPGDFPFGGISNVPGILMKQAEQTRGAPLAGLAVKVTSGFFLVGLSSTEADMQRNLELLKDRAWFDIPIVYNNGRRAILAVEKGTPGERAFNDAFAAWGE